MISGVAFCPQAPALVPAVGRGLEPELGPVRQACRAAIRRVATPGTQVVVVGGAEAAGEFGPTARGSFAGFGVDLVVPLGSEADGPVELPPSLAVGAWLVRDALGPDTGAIGWAVPPGARMPRADGDTAVVVIGDGSTQRTEKAPGYLHPDAAQVDQHTAHALGHGIGTLLHDEPGAYPGVVSSGRPVWDSLSWDVAGWTWDAELLYDDAPFGVGYLVAAWTNRRA